MDYLRGIIDFQSFHRQHPSTPGMTVKHSPALWHNFSQYIYSYAVCKWPGPMKKPFLLIPAHYIAHKKYVQHFGYLISQFSHKKNIYKYLCQFTKVNDWFCSITWYLFMGILKDVGPYPKLGCRIRFRKLLWSVLYCVTFILKKIFATFSELS
jgi:hypothetical protein